MTLRYEGRYRQDQIEKSSSPIEAKRGNESILAMSQREKEANNNINAAINSINRIVIKLLWENPKILGSLNKKMKGASTFDACWILLWELENTYADKKEYETLIQECRYWLNRAIQAKDDAALMKKFTSSMENIEGMIDHMAINVPTKREWDNPFNWSRTFYNPENNIA